ncbi:MAG: hypothetical protein K940chlam2_00077 [Chlamydiae bacterium]|nr:hypothetical protein [Chlamydiota bacterium]
MRFLIPFFLLFSSMAIAADEPQIAVNNRILCRVNGKALSVMDVMKKMDVYIAKVYPELTDNATARYQFFSSNWKHVLTQMVDNELILADAEKMELKVGDAEVRETLYERFGPSIMPALDKLGITLEEAWQMIYSEMAVQRMSWYRVNSKAMAQIGPTDIKTAYLVHLEKNPPKEEWHYRVLSIRAATEEIGKMLAQKAHLLLSAQSIAFNDLPEKLEKDEAHDPETKVTLSEEYQVQGKDLASSHKDILSTLKAGTCSEPISQVSRYSHTIVHRIFFLKEYVKSKPPTFDAMNDQLHDELVQAEIEKELPNYLSKLRTRFNFDERVLDELPKGFQPFSLR